MYMGYTGLMEKRMETMILSGQGFGVVGLKLRLRVLGFGSRALEFRV